jgi:hypothetical protein
MTVMLFSNLASWRANTLEIVLLENRISFRGSRKSGDLRPDPQHGRKCSACWGTVK